ncbi:YraN family protein [Opitutales bacterium]|nr:YraN family protein [Opitutales bacterium]
MEITKTFKDFFTILRWKFGQLPSVDDAKQRGRYGEWLGKEFLKKKGFHILEKNWRSRGDRRKEIDLVCLDREILVFVEIRARSENALISGFHSLNSRKRKALRRSFKAYLLEADDRPFSYRFDLVEVDLPKKPSKRAKLFHHENIAIFQDTLH